MRSRFTYYPVIRRKFETADEVGGVINRSKSYVLRRLSGRSEFTHKDMKLISDYLGIEMSEVCRKE